MPVRGITRLGIVTARATGETVPNLEDFALILIVRPTVVSQRNGSNERSWRLGNIPVNIALASRPGGRSVARFRVYRAFCRRKL